MKKYCMKLREYMERSLRRQLVYYLVIGVLLPLTIVTAFLFFKARGEMANQAVVNISQRSQAVANQVDELIYNIKSVSDTFAYDEGVIQNLEKDYKDSFLEKQKDIYMLNTYFRNTDPLEKSQRISGIYTKNHQVFNLMEPELDGRKVKEKMVQLGATERGNLSIFQWHPLEDNFLILGKTGDVRKDRVVMGARRILHSFTGSWMYTQFFAIQEVEFYNLYRESAEEMMGSVHIVDHNGNLVSSSDEKLVIAGSIPAELILLAETAIKENPQVTYMESRYIMDMEYLEHAKWRVITMVPVSAATATVDKLFKEIIAIMVLCIALCALIITWISHRFLQPVEVLDASMKEVYNGNLEAYVQTDSYNGEIKSMMTYYNAMLVQINHFIREKVESEKKKKELELEVLMGQINPHFLYNTLENIVWKSNEVGRPDIGRIAASLGRLYRLSIGSGETIVSIQQEVEHVMAYVNIQKNRYKNRMEFDLQVNYEEIWGYSMIKLTLQPVVENCFMYAMEDIDYVLKIRLTIRVRGDVVEFYVMDNGMGMDKDRLTDIRKQIEHGRIKHIDEGKRRRKGTGIGLYSVKERIAIYTGYKDSLTVRSKPGKGTMVKIVIPKIVSKDKNSQQK